MFFFCLFLAADITGSVLSENKPQPGVQVVTEKGSATTDASGAFRLSNLPPGKYTLNIYSKNFYDLQIKDVEDNKNLPPINITRDLIFECGDSPGRLQYYLPNEKGAITGTIISGPNATIILKGKDLIRSTRTNSQGHFSFHGLPPGTYTITAQAPGFFPEEQPGLTVQPGYESVYPPLTLEACPEAGCRPDLKTIRVLPTCA